MFIIFLKEKVAESALFYIQSSFFSRLIDDFKSKSDSGKSKKAKNWPLLQNPEIHQEQMTGFFMKNS